MKPVYYFLLALLCIHFVYWANIMQVVVWAVYPDRTPSILVAVYTVLTYLLSKYLELFIYENNITAGDLLE